MLRSAIELIRHPGQCVRATERWQQEKLASCFWACSFHGVWWGVSAAHWYSGSLLPCAEAHGKFGLAKIAPLAWEDQKFLLAAVAWWSERIVPAALIGALGFALWRRRKTRAT